MLELSHTTAASFSLPWTFCFLRAPESVAPSSSSLSENCLKRVVRSTIVLYLSRRPCGPYLN
jgi:hypothetical protein